MLDPFSEIDTKVKEENLFLLLLITEILEP